MVIIVIYFAGGPAKVAWGVCNIPKCYGYYMTAN